MSVLAELGPSQLPFDSSNPVRLSSIPNPALPLNLAKQSSALTAITKQELFRSSHQHFCALSSSKSPSDRFQLSTISNPVHPSHSRQPSASSNMNNISIQRQPTSSSTLSGLPRRSTSGRSAASNSPTSYVALMRKQKATVWCDRSQSTDPRVAAAQKAARQRAHLEVSHSATGVSSARTSTISSGGVVGKIRHGGVPKAPGYVPANMSGAGVPMRLSANEMLGDEEEEQGYVRGDNEMTHGRSGSGKSSTNSTRYRSGYPRTDQGRFSGGTPPSGGDGGSPASRDRITEEDPESKTEYFAMQEKLGSEGEDSFGELRDMAAPNAATARMEQIKKAEDLRRRGSVDERAMSMGSNVKLFVANPDLDSD